MNVSKIFNGNIYIYKKAILTTVAAIAIIPIVPAFAQDTAASGAQNTADQLNQINLNDYATGRQNYQQAVNDLAGATNVYNPATSVDNAATGALDGQAKTASDISSQNNSWVQAVTGALGGIAGAATTGWMGKLTSGSKGGSKSSANAGAGN